MTHTGVNDAYEVALGPAAIRTVRSLLDQDDQDELDYALRAELMDGPNADKELRFDSAGNARVYIDPGVPSSVVYTATPLSFDAYTAVHRPMTADELTRVSKEQGRQTAGCGFYVVDILPAESAFTRGPRRV